MASTKAADDATAAALPVVLAQQKYQGVERTGAGFLLLQRMGWREGEGLVSGCLDFLKFLPHAKLKLAADGSLFLSALTSTSTSTRKINYNKPGRVGPGHQGARPRQEEIGRGGRGAGEFFVRFFELRVSLKEREKGSARDTFFSSAFSPLLSLSPKLKKMLVQPRRRREGLGRRHDLLRQVAFEAD